VYEVINEAVPEVIATQVVVIGGGFNLEVRSSMKWLTRRFLKSLLPKAMVLT
jgi:hypothetical protein